MKVTDKDYYIDKGIVEKLDLAIARQKVKWDNLWIVDGDEGSGKSTLSFQLAYYIAHKIGKSFTVDNIFFDAEEMMKYASQNEGEVIVWDEAATAGLSSNWQSKIQQKLIQILMMARKKRHFFFFVIPKFWALKDYVVDRSIGMVHVYSPDLITRGHYVYFTKEGKDLLFYQFKQQKKYTYKRGFLGHPREFYDKTKVIDDNAYEAKKDKAIRDLFKDDNKVNSHKIKYDRLKQKIGLFNPKMRHTDKQFAEILGINVSTLREWRYKGAKSAEIYTIEGKDVLPMP